MAVSISDYLGVDKNAFAETGAFDAVLDVDSKLFIDPHLLQSTAALELKGSYAKVQTRFREILKLLEISRRSGDAAWRNAAQRFTFREVNGLCIGYSSRSTSGSGMGEGFRTQLLSTAKQIVDAGIKDPEIFELMGLFEEGVGADRVSDMVARIILADLMAYSQRIFDELRVQRRHEFIYNDTTFALPINPFNRWHIILIPQDILRDLPIAHSFSDIEDVVGFNQRLRARLNVLIGVTWKEARRLRKRDYKNAVLGEPDILRELVKEYRGAPAKRYDFTRDPAGQVNWYPAAQDYARQYPLDLHLESFPKPEAVLKVVLRICQHFKQNIENNGLHILLYRDDACTDPKREEAAQKCFFGIADAHCRANNLDLSPETDSGRGEVDFKVSRGYHSRIIVETKLTTNPNLLHGFERQVTEYQKAEQTSFSVYLVIDVEGGSIKKLRELERLIATRAGEGHRMPEVVIVYGRRRPPASKIRS